MSSIDNRIVMMTFDNDRFEKNLASTLGSLDKLSESLQLLGAREGLSDVAKAADEVDLSRMADALENISGKFSIMGAIGFAAIQKLTHAAMDFARSISDKALGPLLGGGKLRAENLEQARFMFRGLGMDVEEGMQSALDAVDGTAYGLDAAAKVAAQLGGSGMQAGEEMTAALRGIAGVAAMTSTSYEEMGDVFTSAAGKGRISGYELQRIGQRGLNAAAALAEQWGITEQEVRRMASEGEISFEMFAAAMDDAFGEHAQKANETYTGSLANLRAAISRIGASFFGERLEQQRDLFNALTPVVNALNSALQPLIYTILKISGVMNDKLIRTLRQLDLSNFEEAMKNFAPAIMNIFRAVQQFSKAVKGAFRDIFPPRETSLLVTFSEKFLELTERIKMGGETVESVKGIFRGIFSVLAIGIEIIKGVVTLFFNLASAISEALGFDGGGILRFFGNFGDGLAGLKKALVDDGGIKKFFEGIELAITKPVEAIRRFREALANLFNKDSGAGETLSIFERIGDRLSFLGRIGERIGAIWRGLAERFRFVGDALRVVWDYTVNWFRELGSKLGDALSEGGFSAVFDVLNTVLLGGIALLLKKFLDGGININFGAGLMDKISGIFDGLTGTLKAMQTDLKASALLKIAGAVAILTASVMVLSTIDSVSLTKALTAMTVSFGQLIGAMTLIERLNIGTGAVKFAALATGMILLATAVTILSFAVKNLSSMGWEDLAKGLIGVTVLLGGLAVATNLMSGSASGMIRIGLAMLPLAIALNILAGAVKIFSMMSWEEMAQGLIGLGGALLVIAGAMRLMPVASTVAAGVAMIPLAIGLTILAGAVKLFGMMDTHEMVQGLIGIGGGLVIIAAAMKLMPLTLPITAAGLVLVAGALNLMASAVILMSTMNFGDMAKGIGGLGAMLVILAGAMHLMSGAIVGAFAIGVVAPALLVLATALKVLGSMSIGELVTGLVALAATLLILGAAALILAPVTPALFALGVAMTLIGGSFALFGVGAILVAKAFELMAKAGRTGVRVLIDIIKLLIGALPEMVKALISALVSVVKELVDSASVIIPAIGELIGHILDTLKDLIPKAAETATMFVLALIHGIKELFPEIVETGFSMLIAFLTGLRDNIGEIVTLVAEIVTGFLDALAEKVPEIIDSVYNLVVAIFKGVVSKLVNVGRLLLPKGLELIGGLLSGITQKTPEVLSWFTSLPGKIFGWVGNVLGTLVEKGINLLSGLLTGLGNKVGEITSWFGALPGNIVSWVGDVLGKLKEKGGDFLRGLIVGVIQKMEDVRRWFRELPGKIVTAIGNVLRALWGVGRDLIQGMIDGLLSKAGDLYDQARQLKDNFVSGVKSAFSIFSPSRVMMELGVDVIRGFIVPFEKDKSAERSAVALAEKAVSGFQRTLDQIPAALAGIEEFTPTIAPVLDLSNVKKESKNIEQLMASRLSANVSLDQARHISTATSRRHEDDPVSSNNEPTEIKFEQNIYAPTELSVNDIYRNTKSQIALAKEELGVS